MKITAETVKCAKCARCINNNLRLTMDEPGGWKYGCETCYAERIGARAELLYEQAEALRAMANVLTDRYNRSFIDAGAKDQGPAERALRRVEAVERLPVAVDEILEEREVVRVQAMKKLYDAEYFGNGKRASK